MGDEMTGMNGWAAPCIMCDAPLTFQFTDSAVKCERCAWVIRRRRNRLIAHISTNNFRITGDRAIVTLKRYSYFHDTNRSFSLDVRLLRDISDDVVEMLWRTGKVANVKKLWAMK